MNVLPRFITHNASLKLLAFVGAVFLWAIVPGAPQGGETITEVPVRVQVAETGWTLAGPPEPDEVQVRLSGPTREIISLLREGTTIRVLLDQVGSRDTTVVLRRDWVGLSEAPGVVVEDVVPGAIRVQLEPASTEALPLNIRTTGRIPAGFALAAPLAVNPPLARATGPTRLVGQLEGLPLAPLDLRDIRESGSYDLPVDTSGLGEILVSPQRATVRVRVEPAVERRLTGVPVEVADAPPFAVVLDPDTTDLVVTGASVRLDGSPLSAIRIVVDGRLLEDMEPGETRSVALGILDVPSLLTARAPADSVRVVRPEDGAGGAR